MTALVISGSSVHNGGLECEVDDCLVDSATPATSSAWRIRAGRTATWLCCDRHRAQLQSSDGVGENERNGIERWLYLPLLRPDDPYARIAVEELCYAIAALGASCLARPRAPSHPLCGFDVYGFGTRKPGRSPCRARATQVAEEWLDNETGGDLYLCDRHAKLMRRREKAGGGEFSTSVVLDFGGGA